MNYDIYLTLCAGIYKEIPHIRGRILSLIDDKKLSDA